MRECKWCDKPKKTHAHQDASAMRGETAREHVFEPVETPPPEDVTNKRR